MTDEANCCKNCHFSELHTKTYYGGEEEHRWTCHRYPPVLDPENGASTFPQVSPDWWCGEHKEEVEEE